MIRTNNEQSNEFGLHGGQIEEVESLKYLASIIETNWKIGREINDRMGKIGR